MCNGGLGKPRSAVFALGMSLVCYFLILNGKVALAKTEVPRHNPSPAPVENLCATDARCDNKFSGHL
jgi:hypothetical protein